MKTYSFEKLECWQRARELAVWVYTITQKFPGEEKFGMVSQMRRSAISIASNLAEGSSRRTQKDKNHFSTIAYSSTMELLNDIIIARDLQFIPETLYLEGREKIEYQTFLISKLRATQQESKPSKPS
jgi:four helix bundle protein